MQAQVQLVTALADLHPGNKKERKHNDAQVHVEKETSEKSQKLLQKKEKNKAEQPY